jgi:hypothetical protein
MRVAVFGLMTPRGTEMKNVASWFPWVLNSVVEAIGTDKNLETRSNESRTDRYARIGLRYRVVSPISAKVSRIGFRPRGPTAL